MPGKMVYLAAGLIVTSAFSYPCAQTSEQIGYAEGIMEKILIAAILACQPGHRLVDWSNRFPHGTIFARYLCDG